MSLYLGGSFWIKSCTIECSFEFVKLNVEGLFSDIDTMAVVWLLLNGGQILRQLLHETFIADSKK